MNALDLIFILVIAFFTILGLWKGFFREVLGLIGIIGGLFLGIMGFGPISKILSSIIPAIPAYMWPFLSFIAIFIAVYLSSRILAGILSSLSKKLFLGWLNRLLGGTVGFVKGALLISFILLVIGFLPFQDSLNRARQDSRLYNPLQKFIPGIYNFFSSHSVSTQKFENKITGNLQQARVKLNQKILDYFFYGKPDSSNIE